MPHIDIKYFPVDLQEGKKTALVQALTAATVDAFGCDPQVISIALEPVEPAQWKAQVYDPCIDARRNLLCKVPNY